MSDLDQGGTARQTTTSILGPTFGPIRVPFRTTIVLTSGGTYPAIDPSIDLVQCNNLGNIFISLPTIYPALPAQPALFALTPVTFMDVAGTAVTFFTQVFPQANWSINGAANFFMGTNWFSHTFTPNPSTRVWIVV